MEKEFHHTLKVGGVTNVKLKERGGNGHFVGIVGIVGIIGIAETPTCISYTSFLNANNDDISAVMPILSVQLNTDGLMIPAISKLSVVIGGDGGNAVT
jgi:hypothetical protein